MKMIDKPFGKGDDFKMLFRKKFLSALYGRSSPKALCDTFKYRKSNLISTIRHPRICHFLFVSILFMSNNKILITIKIYFYIYRL